MLKSTGVYTQAVGSNALAAQVCGLIDPFVQDLLIPAPGSTAFYLTTGVTSTGSERPLGPDSSGTQRVGYVYSVGHQAALQLSG